MTPTLPFLTLVRIAVRSLFIQAGFSPEAMQTLGLLYALAPAWPHLYADEASRQAAVRRHLTPFNTHPYAAAALVGAMGVLAIYKHRGNIQRLFNGTEARIGQPKAATPAEAATSAASASSTMRQARTPTASSLHRTRRG